MPAPARANVTGRTKRAVRLLLERVVCPWVTLEGFDVSDSWAVETDRASDSDRLAWTVVPGRAGTLSRRGASF